MLGSSNQSLQLLISVYKLWPGLSRPSVPFELLLALLSSSCHLAAFAVWPAGSPAEWEWQQGC